MISEFVAHDSMLQFGDLNHVNAAALNTICGVPFLVVSEGSLPPTTAGLELVE